MSLQHCNTEEIQESLLSAKNLGQRQVDEFVSQRLSEPLLQVHQTSSEPGKAMLAIQFSKRMHRNNP